MQRSASFDGDLNTYSPMNASEQTPSSPLRHRKPFSASQSSPFRKQQALPPPMGSVHSSPASVGSDVPFELAAHPHSLRNPAYDGRQPSSTTRMAAASHFRAPCIRMLVVVVVLAMIACPTAFLVLHRIQKSRSDEPLQQLGQFARTEAANIRVDKIEDLAVDGYKLYAQAACVKGPTVEHVKDSLRAQLRQIPQQAREDIIASAVKEGMEAVSTLQDTSADLQDSGSAFSYLAYWNTKYNGDPVLLSDRYSTCIMATGVKLKVGEDVAGYEESSRMVAIGTRPCKCGMLWCVGSCPEYERVTTKTPIFKRHRLTLRNQVQLHQWMVKQAVDRAESLVRTNERLVGKHVTFRRRVGDMQPLAWQPPQEGYFTGDDSAAGAPPESQPNLDEEFPKQDL